MYATPHTQLLCLQVPRPIQPLPMTSQWPVWPQESSATQQVPTVPNTFLWLPTSCPKGPNLSFLPHHLGKVKTASQSILSLPPHQVKTPSVVTSVPGNLPQVCHTPDS